MSHSRYPIPARTHRVEETIQRSRFITTLSHVPESAVAHEFVRQIRSEFPDATHHCCDRVPVEIVIGYETVTELHHIMTEMEVLVEGEEYGERVQLQCAVPTVSLETFSAAVADATSGTGSVTRC